MPKFLLSSLFPDFGHKSFSINCNMALLTFLIVSLQFYVTLGRPPAVQSDTQAVDAFQIDDSNTTALSYHTALDSLEEAESEGEWVPLIRGEHPDWPLYNLTKRAQDLGGQQSPSKQGVFPKGYTSYGGQVWECPAACECILPPVCIWY